MKLKGVGNENESKLQNMRERERERNEIMEQNLSSFSLLSFLSLSLFLLVRNQHQQLTTYICRERYIKEKNNPL